MFWLILIALITLALIYLLIIRPILKQSPLLAPAFAAEASIADKVRAKLVGFRTMIAAWLTVISGAVSGSTTRRCRWFPARTGRR